MDELKSSMEIALERTKNLRLSKEEREGLKRDEFVTKAKALISKYLESNGKPEDWSREFSRMGETERELLAREMMNLLMAKIDISLNDDRVFEGIKALNTNIKAEIIEKIKNLLDDYRKELGQSASAMESTLKEKLKKSGISGSAIKIKSEGNSTWQEMVDSVSVPFQEKLDALKKNLF